MVKYLGHSSWNAWNVSLWINNDEALYRRAQECIHRSNNKHSAAQLFFAMIQSETENCAKTPDGAPYSVTTIRAAMKGM